MEDLENASRREQRKGFVQLNLQYVKNDSLNY